MFLLIYLCIKEEKKLIYIYDIILNWSDKKSGFEFFEWEYSDDIEYVKKIPIIKIKSIKDIVNNDFSVDKNILSNIKNMTEVYTRNKIKRIEYALVICDSNNTVAVEFDSDGKSRFKSNLQLAEESEVLEIVRNLDIYDLDYKVLSSENKNNFLTRKEKKIKKFLRNEILRCYRDKKIDKLEYLYLEYFNKSCEDLDKIVKRLINSLENIDDKHIEMFNLLNMSYRYNR